jgi:hypothetical protein
MLPIRAIPSNRKAIANRTSKVSQQEREQKQAEQAYRKRKSDSKQYRSVESKTIFGA